MVLEKIIITDLQKVSGNIERKLTACGIVKLLCDCPAMFTGIYQKFWVPLFDVRYLLFVLYVLLIFHFQGLIEFLRDASR